MKKHAVLKLILIFFELSKKYARGLISFGGYSYTDDGDGNITISIKEG